MKSQFIIMMKQYYLLALLPILIFGNIQAQEVLPHYSTAEEKAEMKDYLESLTSSVSMLTPNPPPAPVRTMAEWEEIQAIMISWQSWVDDILGEIVRHSQEECEVIIFASNVNVVNGYLAANGIPTDNVTVLPEDYNSIWIRDYGPWSVYHNDVDSLMIVDWIYNRPRPDDDAIPTAAAEYFDLPIYEAIQAPNDWVHTGGNNLRDGLGTNFSSNLVFEENPGKTEAEIDEIAAQFLGVDRYIKFETLPYDAIHHLDMHMRFIDEETVIVGEYPEGVADGPQIEENLEYLLSEVPTAFGNQYNVIRMPMPPHNGDYPDEGGDYRTFTNSIFVNKTLLVPVYEEQYDTTALRIYEEALPGYNVVGIDCNGIIPAFGALHCITKLVGVNEPLWIAHARLRDTEETEEDYPAMAMIKHRSGIAEATLNYRLEGEMGYNAVPMSLVNAEEDMWAANIPAQTPGSLVEYYIHAVANNGKEQLRPMVAPEGFFRFRVLGTPPTGTKDIELSGLDFSLFPNPAVDYVDVDFKAEESTEVVVWLSNALGQEVQLMTQAVPAGESSVRIPVNKLSRGTYEVTIQQGIGRSSKKLLIAR